MDASLELADLVGARFLDEVGALLRHQLVGVVLVLRLLEEALHVRIEQFHALQDELVVGEAEQHVGLAVDVGEVHLLEGGQVEVRGGPAVI